MSLSVVVVDDDLDTLEIFEEYLTIKGVEVLGTGKNGYEAVELFVEHKPDVILLDVMMPNYDGFYALENIKKIHPQARAIMVTADKTVGTRNKLLEMKADVILYKPYEINKVVESIKKTIDGEAESDDLSQKIIPFAPNIQ